MTRAQYATYRHAYRTNSTYPDDLRFNCGAELRDLRALAWATDPLDHRAELRRINRMDAKSAIKLTRPA